MPVSALVGSCVGGSWMPARDTDGIELGLGVTSDGIELGLGVTSDGMQLGAELGCEV